MHHSRTSPLAIDEWLNSTVEYHSYTESNQYSEYGFKILTEHIYEYKSPPKMPPSAYTKPWELNTNTNTTISTQNRLSSIQRSTMADAGPISWIRTTDVHEKVIFWKCIQYQGEAKYCGNYNSIKLKQCPKCQSRRDAGDEAVNKMGAIIGVLEYVENKTGVEHWRYDSEKI